MPRASGDRPDEAGLDETVALDEPVPLLWLARRAVAVVLARGRFAHPVGDSQAAVLSEPWAVAKGTGVAVVATPGTRAWAGAIPIDRSQAPIRVIRPAPGIVTAVGDAAIGGCLDARRRRSSRSPLVGFSHG